MAETAPTPYIFLSYARADQERARALAATLQREGIPLWLDQTSIDAGTNWGSEIVEGIEGCAALVLLCTEAAMQSRNVGQEVQLAWRYERPYVPLLLEPVAFPQQVQYFLEGWQWVTVHDRPEEEWLPQLRKALARLGVAGRPSSPSATPIGAEAGRAPGGILAGSVTGEARRGFVGRERELTALRAALGRAVEGEGRLALLAGEPGIGKTRLARVLADEAGERGATVLWGRTWEGEGAPAFWPWIEALGGWARTEEPATLRALLGPAAPEIAALVPAVRALLPDLPAPAPSEPEQARFRLFDAVAATLAALAGRGPLLLVLDDLHWADKPTLLLLQYLVRGLAGMRLLVLGLYRDTDLDRRHPLAEALTTLRREPAVERLALGGLTPDEISALLTARAGHALDAPGRALAGALHRETEGNPLFVGETLRHLAESGGLAQTEGRWRLTTASVADLGIPEGVREVIGRRLSRLSEPCNQLLAQAAVIGREFNADVLERVSGENADAVDEALAEAVAAAVVAEPARATGQHRFTHALIRETLLHELPVRRRVRLHRQVGDALEAHYGQRAEEHAAELAYHLGEAAGMGDAEAARAAHYSRLAGDQAMGTFAWEEGIRHIERCLALIEETGESLGQDEAALLVALASCQMWAGNPMKAGGTFGRPLALYRERGDHLSFARTMQMAANVTADRGTYAPLLDEAIAGLGDQDPHLKARLLVYRAGMEHDDASVATAERAVALAEAHGYADILALIGVRNVNIALRELRADEALTAARAAHRAIMASPPSMGLGASLLIIYSALLNAGQLDETVAAVEEGLARMRALHTRWFEWSFLGLLAALADLRGEQARVAALAEEAPEYFWIRNILAAVAERAGEAERALALLPPLDGSVVMPAPAQGWLVAAHTRLRFRAGDLDGSRALLAPLTFDQPAPWVTTYAGVATELDDCLTTLGSDEQVAAAYAESVAAPSFRVAGFSVRGMDRMRGALALRLGRTDEAAAHFAMGRAWAVQQRCPVELGRCLQGLAEVAARRGQPAEARAHLGGAAALFEQHGASLYLGQLEQIRAAL